MFVKRTNLLFIALGIGSLLSTTCGGAQKTETETMSGDNTTPSAAKRQGSTTIYDAWSNANYTGEKIGKIMVMGIGENDAIVDEFETAFTDMLSKTGVEAVKASNVISAEDRKSEEAIVKKLEEAEYNGALVTRLVSVDSAYEPKAPHVALSGQPFLQYYQNANANPLTSGQKAETVTATLETVLYKVPEGEIVWCGTTKSFSPSPERRQTLIGEIGNLVIEKLSGSGLLAE